MRLDGSVSTGSVVSRFYDSLICKVICSATTFPKAVQKMQRALNEFQVCQSRFQCSVKSTASPLHFIQADCTIIV